MTIRNAILENLVLPGGDLIEGGNFVSKVRRYRIEQWLSATELKNLQIERLGGVLDYAWRRCRFYQDLDLDQRDALSAIQQFPVITKRTLRENVDHLLARPKTKLIAQYSSGSSGIQSTVYVDRSAQASQRAMQMLWFEWSGYKAGDCVLQTGITPKRGAVKFAKDVFLRTKYIPAFKLDNDTIDGILLGLKKAPRQYLFGYASSLFVLATRALELNIQGIGFKACVSWGDKLFPHYRKAIQEAFGCTTLDTYGCTEGAMIAAQCPFGSYHLSLNQCFVEILDKGGRPVPRGEMGRVVVTRLDNFAMPLIRYDLGDLAILEPEDGFDCECGRSSPRLRMVVGRNTDIVSTRSGKQLIVHFFTGIFEHFPEIRQFSVIQRTLDEIEVEYIKGPGWSDQLPKKIEKIIHGHLNEPFPVRWRNVAEIPPTASGKPQIVRSLVGMQNGTNA